MSSMFEGIDFDAKKEEKKKMEFWDDSPSHTVKRESLNSTPPSATAMKGVVSKTLADLGPPPEPKEIDVQEGRTGYPRVGFPEGVYPLGEVLDEIAAFNRRFIYHSNPHVHDLVALWVAHTYLMDRWNTTPRLYINSPQPGTGKTTQAEVIQHLSVNGLMSGSATAAAIFASISAREGAITLLLDEADNLWSKGRDTSDLQAIVNSGYKYGAKVTRGRATEQGIEPDEYEAYCPVVIIGIKNSRIPATTLSRCIPINMTLPEGGVKIERYVARLHQPEAEELGRKLEEALSLYPQGYQVMEAPEGLTLRNWDLWEDLFAIAKEAGGDWTERVLAASQDMVVKQEMTPGQKVLLLTFEYLKITHRATGADIAEYINEQDELWELNGQRVAYYLRNYNVLSSKSNGRKVFRLEDVKPVAEQWLEDEGVYPPAKPYPRVPWDTPETPSEAENGTYTLTEEEVNRYGEHLGWKKSEDDMAKLLGLKTPLDLDVVNEGLDNVEVVRLGDGFMLRVSSDEPDNKPVLSW